ncbi:MAG: PspC domain-containing protein [Caldilineaceae bacterium]|nr:PspC domain-containing protein [Caldilineaceae bacterium]
MEQVTKERMAEGAEIPVENREVMTESITEAAAMPKAMLYRHPSDKLVGGVCGGLADYLKWDPSLVRVLWVVATLTTGGGGFLAYLALWLLLPVGTAAKGQVRPAAIELNQRSLGVAANVLIGLGIVWLLANLGILPSIWGAFSSVMAIVFWPALLIGIGYLLLRGAGGAGDWGSAFGNWRERVGGNVKAPSGDEVKASLRGVRQRLPLKRSRTDRFFMGVCGGIGQKLGIDANLVRLIWAAFSIGSVGMGVLVYVLVGLLLPEETPVDLATMRAEPEDVQVIEGTATYKV